MRKFYALLFLLLAFGFSALAQKANYTTAQSGPWSLATTWSGGTVPPTTISAGDQVIIGAGHELFIANHASTANYTITNNGTITINSTGTLTIGYTKNEWGTVTKYEGTLSGTGTITNNGDFKVDNGTATIPSGKTLEGNIKTEDSDAALIINGTLKHNSGKTLNIASGTTTINGTLEWATTDSNLPSGFTWGSSSLFKITGSTSSFPTIQSDSYNDIEIDCAGLSADQSVSANDFGKFTNVTITNTSGHKILTAATSGSTISGNLSIGSNGYLQVVNNAALQVNGTSTVNGILTVQDEFNGVGAVTISGTTSLVTVGTADGLLKTGTSSSNTLTISSSGKLQIEAEATVDADYLTNSVGTNGIEIQSSAAGFTGSLITSSTGVQGTFKQTIVNGYWHLITPPFSTTTAYDYGDESAGNAYMRTWKTDPGEWGDYISNDDPITLTKGYEYWKDGADYSFTHTGTFITGDQTLTMGTGGSGTTDDWSLFGNPYPCGVKWSAVTGIGGTVGSSYYVYDASGNWKYRNATTGTATEVIPAFQGFFVQKGTGSTLTLTNTSKASQDHSLWKDEVVFSNHFRVNSSFNGKESACFIYQQEEATNGFDIVYDAPVPFNNDPEYSEIYSLAGDQQSCINIHRDYPYNVNLGFRVPEGGGEFTIEATDFRNDDGAFTITLEDLETGAMQSFKEGEPYTFTISESGMIEDRIVLHLNSTVGTDDLDNADATTIYSSKNKVYIENKEGGAYDIQIVNMMGQMVYSGSANGDALHTISLNEPTAYYIVKVIKENETLTEKLYITY